MARSTSEVAAAGAVASDAERQQVEYEPSVYEDAMQVPQHVMMKQIVLSTLCIGMCTALLMLTFREVAEGRRWHQYSMLAAKQLAQDHAQLQPLLYTPGVEPRVQEPGDAYSVPPEHAAPVQHWLSGAGGRNQAEQARYDVDRASNPAMTVHIPARPAKGNDTAGDEPGLAALDYRSIAQAAQARAHAEAQAIRGGSTQVPAQQVQVKTLLTSKAMAKWRHCGTNFHSQAVYSTSIMQVIENKDLGTAPFEAAKAMSSLRKLGCVFFTQNCIKHGQPELISPGHTQILSKKEYKRHIPPPLPRGSLGTCAIVGHSDRLLGQDLGFEIDGHTTVVRLGMYLRHGKPPRMLETPSAPPLNGFEAQTGNRSDIVWLPDGRVYTSKTMPIDDNTHMWAAPNWRVFPGKTQTLAGRGRYAGYIEGVRDHVYRAFSKTKLKAKVGYASDELMAVLWWLASGLCNQVDLYGLAFPQPGQRASRAYWATTSYDPADKKPWPGPAVPMANVNLEMYALHAAMRAGHLCVRTH